MCRRNDQRINPDKMQCSKFRVNDDESARAYIKKPDWLKNYTNIMLYAVPLKKNNVKTLCITIHHRETNSSSKVSIIMKFVYFL